jgi:NADH-quinone oxidoreductase subunit K
VTGDAVALAGSFLAAIPPNRVLMLAAVLFAIGLVGVSCRRNVLVILLSVEILLNAANLAFVAFSRVHGDVAGQTFVFFAMTIAAAEVAVGLAIVIAFYRLRGDVDVDSAGELHERDLGRMEPISPEGPDVPHDAHDEHPHDEHAHDAHAEAHGAHGDGVPVHAGAPVGRENGDHAHGGGPA